MIKCAGQFWLAAVSVGGFISNTLKPCQKNCLCPMLITQSLSAQLHILSEMASISTDSQNIQYMVIMSQGQVCPGNLTWRDKWPAFGLS